MKFVAVAIVFGLVAAAVAQDAGIKLTPEQEKMIEAVKAACIKEVGANKVAVDALHKGDFSKVDDQSKCYPKCFQTKMGYIENGVRNEAFIQKTLGPVFGEDVVKAIQAKCNGIKGADECDTALEVYRCYNAERKLF